MRDEWSKKLPGDRTVVYATDFIPGTIGLITAKEAGLTQNALVKLPMTRKQVEAEFENQ
jgi:hypothetical protein